jgi:TolB-like protein/Flp pilus assembly protein TadD
VIAEGSDLYGDGVNIAARLEALADPGGILVSGTAYDHIKSKVKVGFDDLGPQNLKNIAEPVRAYRVTGTPAVMITTHQTAADKSSIAVLPFANMSDDPKQEYFADGITEDLITELSRYRHLSVVARNSSFVYKGRSVKVQQVGRELGVSFVVEGSVRHAGNRVRVSVQLIDAETGSHVWAERFDREIDDIFTVQDEIVIAILARLAFNLDEAAAEQRRRHPTTNITAYSCFLRGRAAWRHGDEIAARDNLLEAVKIDPNYSRALAYLAFFYSYGRFSQTTPLLDAESARLARDYAQRALVAAKSDPFVLQRISVTYLLLGETDKAKRLIEAATAQQPRDIEIKCVAGLVLAFSGQHTEGLLMVEQAIRSEPRLPPGFHAALIDARYLAHDYEGTLVAIEAIVDPPNYVRLCQAASLAQLGRTDEARRIVGSAPKDFEAVSLARNYAAMCLLPDDAQRWLEGFRRAGVDV